MLSAYHELGMQIARQHLGNQRQQRAAPNSWLAQQRQQMIQPLVGHSIPKAAVCVLTYSHSNDEIQSHTARLLRQRTHSFYRSRSHCIAA